MELMKRKTTDSVCQGPGGEHGGNVYKAARDLGIPAGRVIDFSASINPLGLSERARAAIEGNLDGLVHYPDPDADDFRRTVSRLHAIDPGMILPGNGSTELIYLLPRALKPESILVTSPTFSEYERACRVGSESSVKRYEVRKENNFAIEADAFISAMRGDSDSEFRTPGSRPVCQMAYLCNPNNPTGHVLHRGDVLKIADAAMEMKCVLVVDEAFIDFIPEHSVTGHVNDYPNLIVLRSLTKFYALTGLRVGYGVMSKEMHERIRQIREPWTVNNLAQAAAVAALDDTDYIEKTRDMIAKEKEYLENAFRALGLPFFRSAANFYLLNIDRAGGMVSKLRQKGILVRSCSNFRGLDDSYIRVAVRSHEHNELLLKELAAL